VMCGCLQRQAPSTARAPKESWEKITGGLLRKRPPLRRRVRLVRLTEEGRKLIAYVLPRHKKVVKCEMRTLEGREQVTLSRLLRKLREGDILKWYREIHMLDEDEKPRGVVG